MTTNELKAVLDEHISTLVFVPSGVNAYYGIILIKKDAWYKAKYSCTEEEKDFKFNRGHLTYKGFELKTL